jgi:hypothetical protein
MEILRIPPYNLNARIAVEQENTEYPVIVRDLGDSLISTLTLTSDEMGYVSVPLSPDFDASYEISVYQDTTYVDVVRPYVDPKTKGTTATEIAEYARNEELARAIIDSIIEEGFYYKKKVIQATGSGSDYIPVWVDAKEVIEAYENNNLVTSKQYEITKDGTAITQSYDGTVNRSEGSPLVLPASPSDIEDFGVLGPFSAFPKTYDYTFILGVGHRRIPSDIVRATELLVEDISCGKLDYYKRYVSDYNTDQFKIKFDGRVFEGTGNLVVDKILSKYLKSIRFIGVL